ncbi:MAG TPA: hypothetical protein VGN17_19245 [Bryobacteraceae bacterium]|jgi:hypothetical protein
MSSLNAEQLLVEIEEILRTIPPRATIRHENPENIAWFGRASAALETWNPSKCDLLREWLDQILGMNGHLANQGLQKLVMLLHQARHNLIAQLPGAGNVSVSRGMVFDYFDEIRKIIQLANSDLLFIDPYLDAGFVSRYLPHVAAGVTIRLLAREKLATLLPAVDAFAQQAGRRVEVRSAANFHDRYVIVDASSCYQSGASFKDGAKSAPTTVTQILDAFPAVAKTYEDLWITAQALR